jgi:phosphatidylglycerophosphatase C
MPITPPNKPVLAAFDFDGTLTYRDSFLLFLRSQLGYLRYINGLSGLAWPAARHLSRQMPRDDLKADLIRRFITGFSVADLGNMSDLFCQKHWSTLVRSNGIAEVQRQLKQGATVTLCSASPEPVLAPFAKRLGVNLIATQLEEINGVLTGAIQGKNCRQAEKVTRLTATYGDLKNYHLRAWGDTGGDKQMLEAADEPYYRWFN